MRMKRSRWVLGILVATLALSAGAPAPAGAVVMGYFLNQADGTPAPAITAAGHTPVALGGLTTVDLAGVNVLWILNGDNGAAPADLVANLATVAAFVSGGGVLSYHDRYVSDDGGPSTNNSVIPGTAGVTYVRDFTDDVSIDIVTPGPVTSGPGGTIVDSSLDNGTSSSHGYALLATLPAGAVPVFSQTDASRIVDFYFPFGAGWVYYSTIPLDYYLGGNGPEPPLTAMTSIYAVNEAAFQANLSAVPEPATLLLLASGLAGLGVTTWRRARRR